MPRISKKSDYALIAMKHLAMRPDGGASSSAREIAESYDIPTDGINLVAHSYGRATLGAGDEIVLSWLEHHSNIVPWQLVCEQTGAVLRVAPINERGEIDQEAYAALLSPRTKMVALGHEGANPVLTEQLDGI